MTTPGEDLNVFATLVRAGDTVLTDPVGVGGLIDPVVAMVPLPSENVVGALTDYEVLISPAQPTVEHRIERIRPVWMSVGRLAEDEGGEAFAAVRLAHPSGYDVGVSFTPENLQTALEAERDVWRGLQRLGLVPARPRPEDVTRMLREVRAVELRQATDQVVIRGRIPAAEAARCCCPYIPSCRPPKGPDDAGSG